MFIGEIKGFEAFLLFCLLFSLRSKKGRSSEEEDLET